MKTLLTFSILLCSSVFSFSQTTDVFICNKDLSLGYHDNYNTANNNFGSAQQNAGFVIPGTNGGVNSNRALFGFDLSSIPPNSMIIDAKLDLYALVGTLNSPLNQGHYGDNSSYLRRVTGNWSEFGTSWNTVPSTTTLNEVILAESTSASQDYLNIDVTDIVADMYANPIGNYSFLLGLLNESLPSKALLFCSINHGVQSKFPKLTVTYQSTLDNPELANNSILVYPNPAENVVTIKNLNENQQTGRMLNAIGQQVMELSLIGSTNNQIDISELPTGVYTIHIGGSQFKLSKI